MKSELLIEDGSFVKKNKNKMSLIATIVLFCTSVIFISLYTTCKTSSKNSSNSQFVEKGDWSFMFFLTKFLNKFKKLYFKIKPGYLLVLSRWKND